MVADYSSWRLSTAGGIKYRLIEGPTFKCKDMEPVSATEKYLIRGRDIEAFLLDAMAPVTIVLGVGLVPKRRSLPGAASLVTNSIDFEPADSSKPGDPMQADSGAPAGTYSEFYHATIEYTNIQYDDPQSTDPETFLEREISADEQMLELPVSKTVIAKGTGTQDTYDTYQQGTTPTETNKDKVQYIYKHVPLIKLILRYKFVLSPNWAFITALLGKVNSTVSSVLYNAPPQTVLFTTFSGRQQALWGNMGVTIKPWSLDFTFVVRVINEGGRVYGWNHTWSPSLQKWVYVIRADSKTSYELANLGALFT